MWDCAGQEKHDAARATAWVGTHALLVVFDLTSKLSYRSARWWIERALASHPTVPIVLVGAKSESASRKLERVALHERYGLPYVEVSSKENAIDAPFECLERLFSRRGAPADLRGFFTSGACSSERLFSGPATTFNRRRV